MSEQQFYLTRDAASRRTSRSKVHAGAVGPHRSVVTACSGLYVAEDHPMDPTKVAAEQRCRAKGCQRRWERWLREVQA